MEDQKLQAEGKTGQNPPHREVTKSAQAHMISLSFKYGIIGGIITLAIFMLAPLFGEIPLWVRFLKYAVLLGVLYLGIRNFKFHYRDTFKFTRGMMLAFGISAILSTVVSVPDLIVRLVSDSFIEPVFLADISSIGEVAAVIFSIFETTIIGWIILGLAVVILLQEKNPRKEIN